MTEAAAYRPSARDIALVFFKRKWSAIAIVMVALLATSFWMFFIREETYQVSAEIMVRGAQAQEPPPNLSDANMALGGYRFQEVGPEAQILASTELASRIVDRFHMDQPSELLQGPGTLGAIRFHLKEKVRGWKAWYRETMISIGFKERLSPREEAIAGIRKAFSAVPVKDTNIIALKLSLPVRKGSSEVLNAWIELYQQYRAEIYLGRAGQDFFQDRVAQANANLAAAEDQLRSFDGHNRLSDPSKEEQVLLEQVANAERSYQEAQIAQQQVETRIAAFAKEAGKPDPAFVVLGSGEKDTLIGDLLIQLATLERERERLRLTDLDTSPRIENNRAQFQEVLEMATKHLNAVLDQRKRETMERSVALRGLQSRLAAVHSLGIDQTRLKRNIAKGEIEYMALSKRYNEARATSELDQSKIGQVAVISRAVDPMMPAGTPKFYLLLAALIGGILLALLWITLAEFFDDGIYTASALENKLHAPVILTVR